MFWLVSSQKVSNSPVKNFPLCPYDYFFCRYFDSILGCSECSVWSKITFSYFRCSRLPLWVSVGKRLAVLRGGCLHV